MHITMPFDQLHVFKCIIKMDRKEMVKIYGLDIFNSGYIWRFVCKLSHCFSRYLFCCSYAHNIAPKRKYITFVSTETEIDNPETELKLGIDLLGLVNKIFYDI